ncbi:50S ribosomal protein L15 [Candidatus Beckwithbacteria bacterium]|nr:50S ribosomal protein L15 [Candidatus Beckwithbacteria bacterium]
MELNNLVKTTSKAKKRIGRGYGSGKGGHTSSRGAKGQNSRSGGRVALDFEGTKKNKDFFRRVPMLRGKSKLKSHLAKPVIIYNSELAIFDDGAIVDEKALVAKKLISAKNLQMFGVKILFDKAIDKKLEIKIPASKAVLKK